MNLVVDDNLDNILTDGGEGGRGGEALCSF